MKYEPVMPVPSAPTDFVDGITTIAGNGDVFAQVGIAMHAYHDANKGLPPSCWKRSIQDPTTGGAGTVTNAQNNPYNPAAFHWSFMLLPYYDQGPLHATIPANTPFDLTSAQRRNLLIKPTQKGVINAKMEFIHWITGRVQDDGRGVINTKIVVT